MNNPQARRWLPFTVCCMVLLAHVWYYYPFVADDAFISYRYGQRMLEGKGLTWNDGKSVEGYSNLLWVLVVAGLQWVTGLDFWVVALLIGLSLSVATLFILQKWIALLLKNQNLYVFLSGVLFSCAAPVAIWVNGGLEAVLLMVLICYAVYRVLAYGLYFKNIIFAGILLGLAAITRPDGILFAFALVAGIVISDMLEVKDSAYFSSILKNTKYKLLLLLLPVAFFLMQVIFRLFVYGEWVPNTALVKIGFTVTRLKEGFSYAASMVLCYIPFIIICFWQFKKMLALHKKIVIVLFTIIAMQSAYLVFIGGDIFPGYRHFLPILPFMVVIATISIYYLLQADFLNLKMHVKYALSFLVIVAMIGYQFCDWHNKLAIQERWEWDGMALGKQLKTDFGKINPYIATTAAGALPFYSKLKTLDMLGLNDYYLPRHKPASFGSGYLGHELGDTSYYLKESPDIIFFFGLGAQQPFFRGEKELFATREFQKNYKKYSYHYSMDYSLPFPFYKNGMIRNILINKSCDMYVKTNSEVERILISNSTTGH